MIAPQVEAFRQAVQTVAGQLLAGAGYQLLEEPLRWSGGQVRFQRDHAVGARLVVAYQLLAHPDQPGQFQITLARLAVAQEGAPTAPATGLALGERSLSSLLWHDFGLRLLSGPEHWWRFHDQRALGDGLLESGKLLAGYGLPWLDGSLVPPQAPRG